MSILKQALAAVIAGLTKVAAAFVVDLLCSTPAAAQFAASLM